MSRDRIWIFDKDGTPGDYGYAERQDAEDEAEHLRAAGEYAWVGTFEEWNRFNRSRMVKR